MKSLLVGALILVSAPVVIAQAVTPSPKTIKTCSLHGQISDPVGASVGKAFVLVHRDSRVKFTKQVEVDANGRFEVQLEPGLYDFFVGSAGFLPIAKEVDIRTCKPVDLKLRMQVDSKHLEANQF
jgi:hypothetical protein